MLQPSARPVAPMAPAQPGGIGLAPESADIADALPTMRPFAHLQLRRPAGRALEKSRSEPLQALAALAALDMAEGPCVS